VNGHWYRSRTNWSLLLRDECHTQKGEHTAAIQLYKQVNYGWIVDDPVDIEGREAFMAKKMIVGGPAARTVELCASR